MKRKIDVIDGASFGDYCIVWTSPIVERAGKHVGINDKAMCGSVDVDWMLTAKKNQELLLAGIELFFELAQQTAFQTVNAT